MIIFLLIILVDVSLPAPQGTLQSMIPDDPIEPVAEWTWGDLGNGFVYVSPRQLGGVPEPEPESESKSKEDSKEESSEESSEESEEESEPELSVSVSEPMSNPKSAAKSLHKSEHKSEHKTEHKSEHKSEHEMKSEEMKETKSEMLSLGGILSTDPMFKVQFQAASVAFPTGLPSEPPYTLFLPTESALVKAGIEKLLTEPEALKAVLARHAVAGKVVTAEDIIAAGMVEVENAAGEKLSVSYDKDKGVSVKSSAGVAMVSTADIMATDGVIHVIDAVI